MRDFFVLDTLDMVPKSDMATMEHPIYSLSTKPERRRLSYTNGECKLELIPSSLGLPTVFDKDIMIYCISKLMRMQNEGKAFGPVVRLSTHDMLVETNRPTNNLGYERLLPALNRLRGVVINTTIATGDERTTRGFGLIDEFEYNRRGSMFSERLRYLEIKLSDWIYRAITSAEVLPISRDYFRLRAPVDRRIYEIVRKHCGRQPIVARGGGIAAEEGRLEAGREALQCAYPHAGPEQPSAGLCGNGRGRTGRLLQAIGG